MAGWGKCVVVVCGPTATGKSALALALARRYGGAVVGADSMQVYRGLVVGTAALRAEEAAGVPLRLMSFVPPEQAYSVANWLNDARVAIDGLLEEGLLPVVCGGTGQYIKSLVEGTRYAPETPEPALRLALQAQWEAEGGEAMLLKLAQLDADRAKKLHVADKKRVLRALELCLQTGRTAEERNVASRGQPPYRTLCIGLDLPERQRLYTAIDARVDAMLGNGLLNEARMVYEGRQRYKTAAQAIGYKEFFPYFEAVESLQACVARLKQATRNYAKRQLSWFRGMEGICWLDAGDVMLAEKAAACFERFAAEV